MIPSPRILPDELMLRRSARRAALRRCAKQCRHARRNFNGVPPPQAVMSPGVPPPHIRNAVSARAFARARPPPMPALSRHPADEQTTPGKAPFRHAAQLALFRGSPPPAGFRALAFPASPQVRLPHSPDGQRPFRRALHPSTCPPGPGSGYTGVRPFPACATSQLPAARRTSTLHSPDARPPSSGPTSAHIRDARLRPRMVLFPARVLPSPRDSLSPVPRIRSHTPFPALSPHFCLTPHRLFAPHL